jgi:hypothetical protein
VTRSEKTLVSKGIVTSIEALAISAYELNLSSMAAKKISFVFKIVCFQKERTKETHQVSK